MLNFFRAFFDTRFLNPHGICLLWRPELLWTHVASDLFIGVAYFSIPMALGVFLYHRRDVRFGWAVWMFVAFIMLCGVTHFMSVWTLWHPDYGIEAVIKAVTALASVLTAVALWPLLPKAIAMPSTATLMARIAERDEAVRRLQEAARTMVAMEEHQAQQDRLLAEIRSKEAELRSVFENAAVGIARVGLDGHFLEVNTRFSEIVGYPRAELLADGFQKITHPDDLAADLEHVQRLLDGVDDEYALDKRYLRPDGTAVWVELTVSVVGNSDGSPNHFVAIIQDITDKRRVEEARLLLTREVDHRARNALTVVQAIIRLTDAESIQTFRDVVLGRVDALARAQASLSQSNWEGALIADVLTQELSALSSPSQYDLEGPALMLRPEDVQPLSMLVHELATNAAKYGAFSTASGRITIGWEEAAAGGLRIHWAEHGGPPARPPARSGFGSKLIEQLARQLRGRVDFLWAISGLEVSLNSAAPAHGSNPPGP